MSLFELAADRLFQEYRRACYEELVIRYKNPELYFERQNGDYYMSYWGAGRKRMEVLFDLNADRIYIYELRFITSPYTTGGVAYTRTATERSVCHDNDT